MQHGALQECPICLHPNTLVDISCGHRFCKKCITQWVAVIVEETLLSAPKANIRCPLCEASFDQPEKWMSLTTKNRFTLIGTEKIVQKVYLTKGDRMVNE